jgi:hypothetical protein
MTLLRTATTVALLSAIPTLCAAESALGIQRRWTLSLRVRLEQPGARPAGIDLGGDWTSTVTAVRPGEYDAALELVGQALRLPVFWATYRDDGTLLALHFFKDTSPDDRNLLQMIAAGTQFVRPNPGRPLWTALERDGAGSYLALYHQPEPDLVLKRKVKYVHTDGVTDAPGRLQIDVDQSELRFSLDVDGIVSLDAIDRARIGVAFGSVGRLTAVTEIHLINRRVARVPALIGSLTRALPQVVSSPVMTQKMDPEQARAQHDDRLLEGRTTESLLESAQPDHLAALFRRRPQAPAAAVTYLRKNGLRQPIADALASAGSPAAIEALASIARDRAAPGSMRVGVLTALILVKHPGPEAKQIAVALLDDKDPEVERAASMVSGALARAARAEHPVEADALDAALIARYRKASETPELCDLLAAFGNSVGPLVLPLVQEALRDPRGPVRAAAARALRLAAGDQVDRLLAATITYDRDPSVRAAAIFAASFRHPLAPAFGEALVHLAREDPVEYVRSEAVTLLRQNYAAFPRVGETLAWVAEHDAKPGVRRLAREALASLSRERH